MKNKAYLTLRNITILLIAILIFSNQSFAMNFIYVGDPSNPADPTTGFGTVGYTYGIGKYEVTNAEYAQMLNNVASSDPYNLYNIYMGAPKWDPIKQQSVQFGGIIRKGISGSYTYSVIPGYENKPVVFVSWRDAARYTNWMMTGNTETGAYDTSTFSYINNLYTDQTAHNPGATYWIPTVDEWYKAAYYDGGNNYWLYPTQSNIRPTIERPAGGTSSANGGYINPNPYLTNAGSYPNSLSYYGTLDQAGNVWEWTEYWRTIGKYRTLHGGGFFDGGDIFYNGDVEKMNSQWQYGHEPIYENYTLGFRIATVIATFAQTYTLNVNKTGPGNGTVLSIPPGINCGVDCSEPYTTGTNVNISAMPDSNSIFAGWSGDCSGITPSTIVTMDAGKTCTATFVLSLVGEYYNNSDLTGLGLTRIDPMINFDWGTGSPDTAIGVDTFSVRWTGKLQVDHNETYTFTVIADDGIRLWIDGHLVLDYWKPGGVSTSNKMDLTAGKHDIKVEYFEDTGTALVKLYWSSPSTPYGIIPKGHLYSPDSAGSSPVLDWVGDAGYTTDGLELQAGDMATVFTYRVKYADADGDFPMVGFPMVHILKGGKEISGSPFVMGYESGDYTSGAVYRFNTTLTAGIDYTYYFDAKDSTGLQAIATPVVPTPVAPLDAPDVSGVDFIISSLTAPTTAKSGQVISVSDTTKNQGTGTAGASTTKFYWSANTTFDSGDSYLGSRAIPSLAPGTISTGGTSVIVPALTCTGMNSFYIIAVADADGVITEINETNNTKSMLIKAGPDLIISVVTAPLTGEAGAVMTVSDTTKNQGGCTAGASATKYYLSTNSTFDTGDTYLGSRLVPDLAPGATSSDSISVSIPAGVPAGTYYIIARADADGAVVEVIETNNNSSRSVKIGPDLIVSSLSAPATAGAGTSITVSDTTKNQGVGVAGASTTNFYLSTNYTYDIGDIYLGSRPVAALTSGATSSGVTPVTIPAGTPTGIYYLISVADADGAVVEVIETNNNRYISITIP